MGHREVIPLQPVSDSWRHISLNTGKFGYVYYTD